MTSAPVYSLYITFGAALLASRPATIFVPDRTITIVCIDFISHTGQHRCHLRQNLCSCHAHPITLSRRPMPRTMYVVATAFPQWHADHSGDTHQRLRARLSCDRTQQHPLEWDHYGFVCHTSQNPNPCLCSNGLPHGTPVWSNSESPIRTNGRWPVDRKDRRLARPGPRI